MTAQDSQTGQSGTPSRSYDGPRTCDIAYLLVMPVLVIGVSVALTLVTAHLGGIGPAYRTVQIITAGVVVSIGAVAGAMAIAVVWLFWPGYLAQGVLAAVVMRLLVTLLAVTVTTLLIPKTGRIFVLAVGVFYIIGLISETAVAIRTVHRASVVENGV